MFVGRWSYLDLLAHLDDLGVCPGTPATDMFLGAFDLLMRQSMDVRSIPGSGGPGVPCDAVSAALPFESGIPVRWGGTQPLELVPGDCP